MSTDIALRSTDDWANALPAVAELSNKIANTTFVPTAMRGKVGDVAACILTGREIGIGPMESLQKIHVIEGRPTMAAELMRAQVLRAGHFLTFGEMTNESVTITGRRKGESGEGTTVTYTIEDAKRAGLDGRANYKKHPRSMLMARATSELCRAVFPDVLGGVSYTPDEVEDDRPEPPARVTAADVVRRPAAAELEAAPVVDAAPAAVDDTRPPPVRRRVSSTPTIAEGTTPMEAVRQVLTDAGLEDVLPVEDPPVRDWPETALIPGSES